MTKTGILDLSGNFESPVIMKIEIEDGDGGFYLYRLNESGCCLSDTWHESLEEAKIQAEFEFGVKEGNWK